MQEASATAGGADRVAIVTGGASGIGRAYSRALAGEGYNVVIADLLDGNAAVDEIGARGGTAASVVTDVSDMASTEAMADFAVQKFGRIDALINNAAYFKNVVFGPFEDLTVEEWDKAFQVNVRGVWLCSRAVAPHMRERKYGKIINIASAVVARGVPGFLHYVASKSALLGLTRSLANELGDDNVCVNTVAPDLIPDEEIMKSRPAVNDVVVAQRVFKRTQTPDDMLGTILYLAGPGSDFVTGQSFHVNGGTFFQ